MSQANLKTAPMTETEEPHQSPVPSQVDEIVERLHSGDTAIAQRRDLGELHKRLATMVASMAEGLGEAQTKRDQRQETAIGTRLTEIENAMNGLESALRIELEPMISRSLAAHASDQPSRPRRRWPGLVLAFLIGGGIALAFADQLRPTAIEAYEIAKVKITEFVDLSSNGGIGE